MRSLLRPLPALLLLGNPVVADCNQGDAIWAVESKIGRAIFYYTERHWWMGGLVRFELWQGQKMVWRIAGELTCSNGVVGCFLDVPLSNGETVSVPAEHYTEPGADHASHITFAHLAESTYRAQGYRENPPRLVAEFGEGFSFDAANPPVIPSAYKFLACKDAGSR